MHFRLIDVYWAGSGGLASHGMYYLVGVVDVLAVKRPAWYRRTSSWC